MQDRKQQKIVEENAYFEGKKLVSLQLHNVTIKYIPELDFEYLRILEISNIPLQHMEKQNKLPNLESLGITFTPLTKLPKLYLPKLKKLNLSNNSIISIDDELDECKAIRILNLSSNRISALILPKMLNLVELDLSNNKLRQCPPLSQLPNIEKIKMIENLVELLDETLFHMNSKLSKIEFQYNRITSIHPDTFKTCKLKWLYLNNNRITEIPPDLFKGQESLVRVELSYNKISTLHKNTFRDCKSLEWLDLANNMITNIDSDLFRLERLIRLDLSNNSISELPADLFKYTPKLKILILSDNKLTQIPKTITLLSNLWELYLGGQGLDVDRIIGRDEIQKYFRKFS